MAREAVRSEKCRQEYKMRPGKVTSNVAKVGLQGVFFVVHASVEKFMSTNSTTWWSSGISGVGGKRKIYEQIYGYDEGRLAEN